MRDLLDRREHDVGRRRVVLVFVRAHLAAAVPREAEIFAGLVARSSSPGGMSSPMPSTWLSLNHSVLSFGLKSRPTGLRTPVA